MAEGEGFEPPLPFGKPVFKTGAIVHSATLPKLLLVSSLNLSNEVANNCANN
jgi:hypothetical protein